MGMVRYASLDINPKRLKTGYNGVFTVQRRSMIFYVRDRDTPAVSSHFLVSRRHARFPLARAPRSIIIVDARLLLKYVYSRSRFQIQDNRIIRFQITSNLFEPRQNASCVINVPCFFVDSGATKQRILQVERVLLEVVGPLEPTDDKKGRRKRELQEQERDAGGEDGGEDGGDDEEDEAGRLSGDKKGEAEATSGEAAESDGREDGGEKEDGGAGSGAGEGDAASQDQSGSPMVTVDKGADDRTEGDAKSDEGGGQDGAAAEAAAIAEGRESGGGGGGQNKDAGSKDVGGTDGGGASRGGAEDGDTEPGEDLLAQV